MFQSTSYSMNSYCHLSYQQTDATHPTSSDTGGGAVRQAPTTPQVQPNGYPMITESCKRDFFTIRADCVQDAVLASVDSLAEYLVWDGMDRRARAIASVNHTSHPEVVVSIKQIAADIKSRVGHDLCERTIERAIRKLSETGLIGVESRFHAGRRQASSYRLLFSDGMKSRLDATRRGGKGSAGNPTGQPAMTSYRDEYSSTSDIPDFESAKPKSKAVRIDEAHPVLSYVQGPTRIGLMVPSRWMPPLESGITPSPSPSEHICTQATTGEGEGESVQVVRMDNPETKGMSPGLDGVNDNRLDIKPESAHHERLNVSHPTSMSPLFKKEKENKKVFKNVYSFLDFSKKENRQSAIDESDAVKNHGYYLDMTHHAGWVSSNHQALKDHKGELSKCLFFKGYRTMEAMAEWFQQQEQSIQSGERSMVDVLADAGLAIGTGVGSIGGMENREPKLYSTRNGLSAG